MTFITLRVTGFDQLLNGINGIQQELPNVKREILREGAEFFYKDALRNVHVISGKTKDSIKIESVTDKEAIISAGFGAKWEEMREGSKPPPHKGSGTGPHKTFTQSTVRTKAIFPSIIIRRIRDLLARHRSRV